MTTHDDTEVFEVQSHVDHHRRQQSHNTLWLGIVAIVAIVSMFTSLFVLASQRQAEARRANQASVAVDELCDQVRRMGAVCVVNPDDFRGERGDIGPQGERGIQGPRGPVGPSGVAGPTGAPGPVGPTGPQGENGGSGASCPNTRLITVHDPNGKPIQVRVCVP